MFMGNVPDWKIDNGGVLLHVESVFRESFDVQYDEGRESANEEVKKHHWYITA